MPMDLVQLRTFVTVADEGHLTRASERLFISQSTASAHIRGMEQRLKIRLFTRTNRSLVLTQAGQLLAQKAKLLLNEDALFTSFARGIRGEVEGKLVVGTSSEPGTRAGDIVTALLARHPLVNIDLMARPSSGTRSGLQSGELDVGVLLGMPVESSFMYYKLTTVQYKVAGPAAWKDRIINADWSELASLPWLTPSASSAYSAMLMHMFGDKGLELNSVLRFDNSTVGRTALQAGAGLMLIREEHADQGEKEGCLAVSPIASTTMDLFIAHQRGRRDDPLIEMFIEAARDVWPDMHLVETREAPRLRPD